MTAFSVAQFIATHTPNNGRFFTIAIDGRGGSGKSVLAEYIKKLLPGFTFINGDDYFEPIDHPAVWGDFNNDRFQHDVIEPLRNGSTYTYRPYDWHREPHITGHRVTIDDGFCLERCYSFTFDLDWDLKIWVESPESVCLARGIAREHMPRDQVRAAWQFWQQAEDAYIQGNRPADNADLVLDGTKPFEEQIV